MMESEIKQLEEQYNNFNSEVSKLDGRVDYLKSHINKLNNDLEQFKQSKNDHEKAVEILNVVQKITRDSIKEEFESLVSYALKFILNNEYEFGLEFGSRGNLQEMDFNIKTPHFNQPLNLFDTSAGAELDVVSVALRLVLLEVSQPKNPGFIIFDESFKHTSKEFKENAPKFINEISNRLNRQIIFISHQSEFVDNPDYNKIEIKNV